MRKANKAVNGPLASFISGQFIKDGSPFIDDDATPRIPGFLKATPKTREDDHLLSGFVELRSILTGTGNLQEIDVLTLLQPFLIVIRSSNTSGFITGIVVNSLTKLIKYGIINTNNKNIHQGLGQTISALSHCKFEGSDQTQDDILLIKIIQLIELIVLSDLGDLLTDDSMYESVSTCFSLAANTRRRDILRSTAETTLINITQKMFSKLKDIESTHDDHNVKDA
ncbi:unnamed protein product [Ambrosiozyma monospora]|uniref:Unnamed protein product n=1 Tax=Ambrosiozyma monospora TaxID=43982 RepID=A0ACB5UD56_AMBMO|nr:unnamed protein product [Ambrosiozyma monospora]